MKIKGSKIGTIVASTGVVIFTLAAAFSGSYAWFQAMRNPTTSADDFKIVNTGSNVSAIEFHQFAGIQEIDEVEYFTFNPTPAGEVTIDENQQATYTIQGGLQMAEYTTDDPHHPILILLTLTGSPNAMIKARRTTIDPSYDYMASDEYTLVDTGNPLSSVVEFYSFLYTPTGDTSLSGRTKNGYYTLLASDFERDTSDAKSFPEFDDSGDYTDNFRSQVSIYNGSTVGYSYLGIVVDYFAESLEYIFSYFLGNDYLTDGLSFSCDWSLYL